MSKGRILPVFIGITGILLFSTKAVFAKLIYSHGANAVTALALRMIFSLPIYVVMLFTLKARIQELTRKDYFWLLFFGVIGYYLSSYLDFKGLEYIKAGLERLILFIYPTLVMIISFLAFGERLTKAQLLGVGITYLGILVVFVPELQLGEEENVILGAALVFMSALTYGTYIVGSGWLIPKFGVRRFTTYAMIISGTLILIHYLIETGTPVLLLDEPAIVYIYGLCMAIFSTVLPSYFVSYGIKGLGASNFSIFGSLGPISTIILAYMFLGERLTILQILGGLIVIGGVMTAEYFRKRKSPKT